MHDVNDVRPTKIRAAELLVPESISFGVQNALEKLKRHKSPGALESPAE